MILSKFKKNIELSRAINTYFKKVWKSIIQKVHQQWVLETRKKISQITLTNRGKWQR